MYVTAIILAAGRSQRLGSALSKSLIPINGRSVIMYCLRAFSIHPLINDLIVVVNDDNSRPIAAQIKKYHIRKVKALVRGGVRRQDSVKHGLRALADTTDLVLIHDAARPFIDKDMIATVIKEAYSSGAAITGVPVKATIKIVDSRKSIVRSKFVVKKTLDRSKLWEIQTPQAFRKDLIARAYASQGALEVTDDAMLVEKLGAKVAVVMGSYNNIKITTPEDLVIAEAILKKGLCKV